MTLGTRIAAMRGYRRLNQESLGGMVGVTKQTVSGWENDRRKPDAVHMTSEHKTAGKTVCIKSSRPKSSQTCI